MVSVNALGDHWFSNGSGYACWGRCGVSDTGPSLDQQYGSQCYIPVLDQCGLVKESRICAVDGLLDTPSTLPTVLPPIVNQYQANAAVFVGMVAVIKISGCSEKCATVVAIQ